MKNISCDWGSGYAPRAINSLSLEQEYSGIQHATISKDQND